MIDVKNLTKKYDNLLALDNINMEIAENEVFGLLGPNGAGKTTLIHILSTLLKPTAGKATVNGYDISTEQQKVRSSIGVVFQAPSSDDTLTGYENLKVHSLLYGLPRSIREKRINEVLTLVGLVERKDNQVKKYSGGMRRRLEIARGLLHKPRVIFLDEPTLGLDPRSRESMWDYIKNLVSEENVTIVLTTHYMEEADALCNRIGFISNGKIIASDTPSKLKNNIGGDIIKVKFSVSLTEEHFKAFFNNQIFHFLRKIEKKDDLFLFHVADANKNMPVLLKYLENVESIDYEKPTLNDVFLQIAGGRLEDDDSPEGGFMQRYAKFDKS
ncbi:MAG: ATP-binding cassette domain-containing protein [Nitrososphaeraceae archaeon]